MMLSTMVQGKGPILVDPTSPQHRESLGAITLHLPSLTLIHLTEEEARSLHYELTTALNLLAEGLDDEAFATV